jgi:hypothetical protein
MNNILNPEKPAKKSNRGGPRPGAGRPKGSYSSPTRQALLDAERRQREAMLTLRELAGQHTADAVAILAGIAKDVQTPAAARVAAIREILDRAHGKAAQSVEVTQKRDAAEYSDADLYAIAGLPTPSPKISENLH